MLANALDSPASPLFQYEHVVEIDSTNAALLRRAASGASIHLQALGANAQTAGRGQHGRKWHTNADASAALLLSVGWHFQKSQSLSGLSLAVGTCVAAVLRESIVAHGKGKRSANNDVIVLKWPNDILLKHENDYAPGKLGGILIETLALDASTRAAVIGIGINIELPIFTAEATINDAFQPLAPAALGSVCDVTNTALSNALLPALAQCFTRFATDGFASFKAPWWAARAYADDIDSTVIVRTPSGDEIVGRMIEITDSGALVVESASGRHTLVSGQVSLRRNDNARA